MDDKQNNLVSTSTAITLIKVQSLQQYIFVKVALNKSQVQPYAFVRTYTFPENNQFLKPICIELSLPAFISEITARIEEELQTEDIKIEKIEKAEKTSSQSIKQFDQKIFGGIEKYSLLKTNYLNQKMVNSICRYLFNEESIFEVKNLQRNGNIQHLQHAIIDGILSRQKQNGWLLIKDKRQTKHPKVYFSSKGLIKLNDWIVVNFHKILSTLMSRCSCISRVMQWIDTSGIFDEVKRSQTFLALGYFAQFKVKLTFPSSDQLASFISKLYGFRLEECLQWTSQTPLKNIMSIKELEKLINCSRFEDDSQKMKWDEIQKYPQKGKGNFHHTQEYNLTPTLSKGNDFSSISQRLINDDIVTFKKYWSRLESSIRDVIENWSLTKYGLQGSIRQLVKIFDFRIDKFKSKYQQIPPKGDNSESLKKDFILYYYLFPNLQIYMKELKQKLKRQPKTSDKLKEDEKKMHPLDKLLCSYFQQIQSINSGKGDLYVKVEEKQKRPFKEYCTGVFIYQYQVSDWEDVFNTITINLKKVIRQLQNRPQIQEQINRLEPNLQFQAFPTSQCLSCMEFFYLNTSIPCRENGCVRLIPASSQIKEYENKIREYICGMLNNSGGVILFNCIAEFSSIYPNGACTTEKDKEAYQNQITNLLNFIHPKPEITNNIVISFVPVVIHPRKDNTNIKRKLVRYTGEDQQLKVNQFYYEHVFVEGLYVLRIKVCPNKNDISKVYIWQSEDQIYHLNGFQKHGTQLRMKNLRKAIKTKFLKNEYNRKQIYRSNTFLIPSCHVCRTPNPGVKISQHHQLAQQPKNLPFEHEYSHVSMIVVRSRYLKQVQDKLTKMKIKCHIQTKFQNYRFKVAINTAVLYHDLRFEEILNSITYNNQFQFDGKMTFVIYVTEYLKLEDCTNDRNRIKDQYVSTTEAWLKQQFPNESLRLFEFRKNQYQKEYYLKTQSRLSTLFIYYVVNNFKIKATFKNPQQLDRMTPQERERTFIEINYRHNKESKSYLLNKTEANVELVDT